MNIKKFLGILAILTLCFVVSFVLTGCGGGGGPAPTNANLHAAGQQIVDDTQAVWGNVQDLAQSKWAAISTNRACESTSVMISTKSGFSSSSSASGSS